MQTKEDFYKLGVQLAVDELLKEGANLAKYVKPGMKAIDQPALSRKAFKGQVKALEDMGVKHNLKPEAAAKAKAEVHGLLSEMPGHKGEAHERVLKRMGLGKGKPGGQKYDKRWHAKE
jgi:hypothetical protein